MADVAVTVVGAGVVGLAIAAKVSHTHAPVYVLERYPRYGQETSSRNSEVIHAGIYYAPGSLKARLCVEGKHRLSELCGKHNIPHRRVTKLITAAVPEELQELESLCAQGNENGAEVRMVSAREALSLEPHITSCGGIYSPTSGIISAHALMDYFYHVARSQGAEVLTHCAVTAITKEADGFRIAVLEQSGPSEFTSERVINAAGLEADTVAAMAGIDTDAAGYRLHYCKGSYFAVPGSYRGAFSRLVYPSPSSDTLGVHVVIDLVGRVRFGPDIEYLAGRTLDYTVPETKRNAFADSVRRIYPAIREEDLTPDTSGIRPKLQGPGEPPRDFVIRDEGDRGLAGLISLIGIESPGLTASPAIAEYVSTLLE
jgi:L-2-hydroxyglutarate oxidase LhgO